MELKKRLEPRGGRRNCLPLVLFVLVWPTEVLVEPAEDPGLALHHAARRLADQLGHART
jgi:hypothetical protein